MTQNIIQLAGQKFDRWTVVSIANITNGRVRWNCVCDCGNTGTVLGGNLKGGVSRSCGCLHKELTSTMMQTHGMSGSKTHNTWVSMVQRCRNPKCREYSYYGGRGITVCNRWLKFENFLTDMGERPTGTTIDRIDNSKGYFLENCRWATAKQQARNTRTTALSESTVAEIRKLLNEGISLRVRGILS